MSIKFGLCDWAGYLPRPLMAQVLCRRLHREQPESYGLLSPAPLICCDREEGMAKSQGLICPNTWSAVPVPEKAACSKADPTPLPENNMQFSSSSSSSAGTASKKVTPAYELCPHPGFTGYSKWIAGQTVFYTTKKCSFKAGISQPNRTLLLGLHSLMLTTMPMNWQQVFSHFACHQPALPLHQHRCQDRGTAESYGWGKGEGRDYPFCSQQAV